MNQDIFEGNWEILKGKIKQKWGEITEDDLKKIEGDHDVIYGTLQKYYGYTEEEIKEQIKDLKD